MISVKVDGDHDKTKKFLTRVTLIDPVPILRHYGEIGVSALSKATPKATGKTSESWYYKVSKESGVYTLTFFNSNIQNGIRIAVILDVGHGTGSGGYVRGRNYIDPAIRPIFDDIANSAWKEVTNA